MESARVTEIVAQLVDLVVVYGIRVLGAIFILIVGRFLANALSRFAGKGMAQASVDEGLRRFIMSLVKTTVMVFAVIAALNKCGVQTTSFVAILAAAGLAVGLALQGSLSNFASGALILLFKPFRIGDFVHAAGVKGKIVDIGIFTTTINTPDHQKIIVPNAAITSGTITNVNFYDTRRVDMTASIAYGDDIGKALQVLTDILAADDRVLKDPAPTIEMVELGDSSVNFNVRPWTKTSDRWGVYIDTLRAIKEQFEANGLSIPFPQQDVHMHQVSG